MAVLWTCLYIGAAVLFVGWLLYRLGDWSQREERAGVSKKKNNK